jgi:hypothetical protein
MTERGAALCVRDATAYAFDGRSMKLQPVARLPADSFGRIVVSPDGRFLAYNHLEAEQPWFVHDESASVFLLDLHTGEERRILPYLRLGGGVWLS